MSELAAIETTALTKSFGWDDADSFQQHDVQELCRVLFDALEREFVGTPLSNVINELWQGTLIDYIDCQACDYARERPDKYLDIPLVIRDMKSIGQSLRRFITPELLSGDNQYSCPQVFSGPSVLCGWGVACLWIASVVAVLFICRDCQS